MQRPKWSSWAGALVVLALIAGTARDAESVIRPGPATAVKGNDNGAGSENDNGARNGNDNGATNGNDNGSDLGACCFADGACRITTREECEGRAAEAPDVEYAGIEAAAGPQPREALEPRSGEWPARVRSGAGRRGVLRRAGLHGTWLGAGTDCAMCDAGNGNDNGAGNGNANDNGSGELCPDGSFQVEAVLTPGSGNDARYRWFPEGCEHFRVRVRDLVPFQSYAVTIAGICIGTLVTDDDGRGELEYDTSDGSFPSDFPAVQLGDGISVGGLTGGAFALSCSGSGNCNGN